MIQPKQTGSPVRHGSGLRPGHMALVGVTTVVAVVVAFAALSSIVGVVAFVVRLVMGHAGRSS